MRALAVTALLLSAGCWVVLNTVAGQTRRSQRGPRRPAQQQAPRGTAAKYSAFLHASDKHKSLACNDCHKVPTNWTAKRDFPDVADFPDHDACVRCHRPQFFTRQTFMGTGPAICTVCHLRAAPREDGRFAFGKPNNSNQKTKPKDERQFAIEFPHDKHQNVIASMRKGSEPSANVQFVRASFFRPATDEQKTDYNNCTICHRVNEQLLIAPLSTAATSSIQSGKFFKTTPHAHDSCFDCHWKEQKPVAADCGGCHKPVATFTATLSVKRISAMFNHEGGQGEHIAECTTCHINITRASSLRGLTPDVPINTCAACHRESKKTTYPKAVTIESELEQFKTSGNCKYCHAADVGSKKPPPSHDATVQ